MFNWRKMFKLKAALALMAAAFIAPRRGACGGDDDGGDGSEGTQEVVYNLPTPPSVLFYPTLVAEELGFFEEEGVSAELAPASEEVAATAFLDNGDADVAFADVDEIILARSQAGEHTRSSARSTPTRPASSCPRTATSRTSRASPGRRSGSSRRRARASSTPCSRPPASRSDDVETAVVGTSGGLIAQLFEDGEIQAYVGNASDFVALGANGVALRNITPEDVGRIDGNPMAVLPDMLEEKREAIVGFLRAWTKAQYVGQVNREVVEQIARERVPEEWRNEDSGEAALDLAIANMEPDDPERIGDLRPDVWETGQDVLVSAGALEEGQTIDVQEALDDSLIEEINDWDRAEVEQRAEEYAAGG